MKKMLIMAISLGMFLVSGEIFGGCTRKALDQFFGCTDKECRIACLKNNGVAFSPGQTNGWCMCNGVPFGRGSGMID
jgi:hypothetical protein